MKKTMKKCLTLLLALAMLLTCTACGKKKAADSDAAPDTKQEQTVDSNTGDTARTEDKKDGTAAGDKTDAKTDTTDTKTNTKTDAANAGQTAADEAKKLEEQKRLEEQKKQEEQKKHEEQKRLEEEKKKQDEQKKQPEQVIDPDTGKDKYETDPVPEGKPTPSEPQDTTVYTTDGNHFDLHLEANEIKWYEI